MCRRRKKRTDESLSESFRISLVERKIQFSPCSRVCVCVCVYSPTSFHSVSNHRFPSLYSLRFVTRRWPLLHQLEKKEIKLAILSLLLFPSFCLSDRPLFIFIFLYQDTVLDLNHSLAMTVGLCAPWSRG